MQAFDYVRPSTEQEVLTLLQDGVDSKLLAGGQSLLASMKLGLMMPERIIDLGGIAHLKQCVTQGTTVRVGAMQSHAQLAHSAALAAIAPGLCKLAGHIADEQVRTMGTIGGSLANADPSACWQAGVLAADAVIHTSQRDIPADDFFKGLFETALSPDELLTAVTFKRPKRLAYYKFEQPASRFALAGVAVAQFDTCVRVALTGTTQGVVRLPAYEHALNAAFNTGVLTGIHVDPELMSSDVHAQADYRAHLAHIAVIRAVHQALEQS